MFFLLGGSMVLDDLDNAIPGIFLTRFITQIFSRYIIVSMGKCWTEKKKISDIMKLMHGNFLVVM
jgi:hypothetical protein